MGQRETARARTRPGYLRLVEPINVTDEAARILRERLRRHRLTPRQARRAYELFTELDGMGMRDSLFLALLDRLDAAAEARRDD